MFAKILKQLRNNAGLTQQNLAVKLKVATSTIGMYESGKRAPDNQTLKDIANLFDVSIDYLLGRTSDQHATLIESAVKDDHNLLEFAKELQERENMQLLFKQVKPMSDADIAKVIKIIKAIEDEEDKQTGGI